MNMKKAFARLLVLMMTISIMTPMQVRAATTYVLNKNSKKFHNPSCDSVSRMKAHNRWDVELSYDEVIAMGYTPCQNCHPGRVTTHVAVSTPTITRSTPTPSVVTSPAVTPSPSSTITPQQAVQQAFVLYMQNGIDQNTALQRVQAKTAEIVASPANIAAIVAADINAIKAQAAVAPVPQAVPTPTVSSLTPQQIVEQAFALYVQGGMDPNTALQRVQAKTAELLAAGSNFAAVVQADLAALNGVAPTAALTPEQIVQQAFAKFIAAGMTQDQALAAVQANLPTLLAAAQ